jgi:GxxExxY protein
MKMAHPAGSRRALPALLGTAGALRHGLSKEILEDRACAESIDAAFAVHEALGAWHETATYKNALVADLTARGLRVHKDATLSVTYAPKGGAAKVVGAFPADLLVDDRVLILVRADRALMDEARTEAVRGVQTGSVRIGLVFNFAAPELFFARVL